MTKEEFLKKIDEAEHDVFIKLEYLDLFECMKHYINAIDKAKQMIEEQRRFIVEECQDDSDLELDYIQSKKVVGKMIDMSVIEDIRAEIIKNRDRNIGGNGNIKDFLDGYKIAFNEALAIIDKHTSGEEQE